MIHTFKLYSLLIIICCIYSISCKNATTLDAEKDNAKADSLSIKLNAPELKAINAQILKEPSSAELYNKRAVVYMQLKQFEESLKDAKRAITLDSVNVTYYITEVDALFSANKTRDAKTALEYIEKKFPESVEALLKLSELFYIVKQYQKAIDYVNKALKIDENLAKAYYLKGSIYRESGDTSKAISSLETAIEQDNKYEDAFCDIGVIYSARKNTLAFEYYNNALKINPTNENAKYGIAKLLQDIGKTDEAIMKYEAMILSNPLNENCLYNLGALYSEIKKDNTKALDYFTKAIAVNPNYTQAYFARGYVYAKLKDKDNARADYNMCLKIEPNYPPALQGIDEL
jgi:tetratricopeptide (TPR) repeat protein